MKSKKADLVYYYFNVIISLPEGRRRNESVQLFGQDYSLNLLNLLFLLLFFPVLQPEYMASCSCPTNLQSYLNILR